MILCWMFLQVWDQSSVWDTAEPHSQTWTEKIIYERGKEETREPVRMSPTHDETLPHICFAWHISWENPQRKTSVAVTLERMREINRCHHNQVIFSLMNLRRSRKCHITNLSRVLGEKGGWVCALSCGKETTWFDSIFVNNRKLWRE